MSKNKVALDFPTDNDKGKKHLFNWFLKKMMQVEAEHMAGAEDNSGPTKGKRIGMDISIGFSCLGIAI